MSVAVLLLSPFFRWDRVALDRTRDARIPNRVDVVHTLLAPYRDLSASLDIAYQPMIALWPNLFSTFVEIDDLKGICVQRITHFPCSSLRRRLTPFRLKCLFQKRF